MNLSTYFLSILLPGYQSFYTFLLFRIFSFCFILTKLNLDIFGSLFLQFCLNILNKIQIFRRLCLNWTHTYLFSLFLKQWNFTTTYSVFTLLRQTRVDFTYNIGNRLHKYTSVLYKRIELLQVDKHRGSATNPPGRLKMKFCNTASSLNILILGWKTIVFTKLGKK